MCRSTKQRCTQEAEALSQTELFLRSCGDRLGQRPTACGWSKISDAKPNQQWCFTETGFKAARHEVEQARQSSWDVEQCELGTLWRAQPILAPADRDEFEFVATVSLTCCLASPRAGTHLSSALPPGKDSANSHSSQCTRGWALNPNSAFRRFARSRSLIAPVASKRAPTSMDFPAPELPDTARFGIGRLFEARTSKKWPNPVQGTLVSQHGNRDVRRRRFCLPRNSLV